MASSASIVGCRVDESDGWLKVAKGYHPFPDHGIIDYLSLVLVVDSVALRRISVVRKNRVVRLTWEWYGSNRLLGCFDGDQLELMVDAVKAIDVATFGPYVGPLGRDSIAVEEGDAVRTKIGGPTMLVTNLGWRSGDHVRVARCTWLNGKAYDSFEFPVKALRVVGRRNERH